LEGFDFYTKTRIYFGENYLSNLSQFIIGDFNRALIVTGQSSAEKHGYLKIVQSQLSFLKIDSIHYNKISPNPKVEEIDNAINLIKENNIDLIIGLGGGSVLDAAKAISAIYYIDGKTEEVLSNQKKLLNKKIPLIQIPTTAGTGSELSMGSILTDEKRKIKTGLRGEVLLADIAVVDPTLTYSLSYNLTMETGFDILTHAIETFFSNSSNLITEIYSVEAIKRVLKYLLRLKTNLNDTEARKELSFASLLMGINLANSSTCLPHRLQYPVGALTNTSHPRGLAALYLAWLEYSKVYNKEKFVLLAKKLSYQAEKDEMLMDLFQGDVTNFINEIGLNIKLSTLGIDSSKIPLLKSKVIGSLSNDPVGKVENIIDKIYSDSL
jgi:alcohol dehydrogenase class IV